MVSTLQFDDGWEEINVDRKLITFHKSLESRDGRSSCASLRTAAAEPRRPKIAPRFLSNQWVRPHTLHLQKIEWASKAGPFYFLWRRGWDSNLQDQP
jgi:hypothetical protein